MNKTYAITDLHGQYDLWEQIKEYCDETDTIFCLGDAIDRGLDGFDIMRELIQDKRVTYLCGNHEEMFQICMSEYLDGRFQNLSWWYSNGGSPTYDAAKNLDYHTIKWYIDKIIKMPEEAEYTNAKGQVIHLSHAGTSLNYSKLDLHYFEMRHMNPFLWDRKHYMMKWPKDEQYENHYVVHGHTPVVIMIREFLNMNHFHGEQVFNVTADTKPTEILSYADGHKFCLDLGSFMTNTAALFDLDELRVEKYFTVREKENENTK